MKRLASDDALFLNAAVAESVDSVRAPESPRAPDIDRDGFLDAVEACIGDGASDDLIAVIVIDINGFSEINFRFGYRAGDAVLDGVFQILNSCLRDIDRAWRIGDDEFALVLTQLRGLDHATLAAARIIEQFQKALEVAGQRIDVRVSLGIANAQTGVDRAERIVHQATIAARRAKRKVRGYVVYNAQDSDAEELPAGYLARLRSAINESRLDLYFQAKVDVNSKKLTGAEALVRWHDPDIGTRSPDEFIPIAERSDLIDLLTRWTLNAGLSQCADWHSRGHMLEVAVNMSARTLINPDLHSIVQRALDTWRLEPNWLTLEITETAMMEDQRAIMPMLQSLSDSGIKLSIDDFGTGYSSLSYLRKLPVKELKIDKSFVLHIDTENEDRLIVKTIIDLAKNFGLSVIAEGVESAESLNVLRELGCDRAQGYYITRPVNASDFAQFILDWNPDPGYDET